MQSEFFPVGHCIFCRDSDEAVVGGPFTDEHIIAFSLGGNSVLPEATCDEHQKITACIDDLIAQKMLGVYRHSHNLPSRTKSGYRPFYKVSVTTHTGITYYQDVPISEIPKAYIAPKPPPPALVTGKTGDMPSVELQMHFSRFEPLMRQLPGGASATWGSGTLAANDFARMLAKVAHTFASAILGHGNFEPLLLEIIEGTESNPWTYVGGFDPVLPQEVSGLSIIEQTLGDVRYWIVSVSLNALPETPRYQVVTGKALESARFPSRSHASKVTHRDQAKLDQAARALALGLYGTPKKKRKH
nr:hypothetical protein [uncultured Albidiferax sp.]